MCGWLILIKIFNSLGRNFFAKLLVTFDVSINLHANFAVELSVVDRYSPKNTYA